MRAILLAMALGALAGCGQKGPLYLPDSTTGEVVTRPASPPDTERTEAPNSPQTPDSQPAPPPPAPEVSVPAPETDEARKEKGATPPPLQ